MHGGDLRCQGNVCSTKCHNSVFSAFIARKSKSGLTTAGLSEVGDGAELCINRSPSEPTVVQVLDGLFRILLAAELYVHVANLQGWIKRFSSCF